jgi:hypothetical protein
MSLAKRLHHFPKVFPPVALIAVLTAVVHRLGREVIPLDGLIPSLIAGAIFLIGFLLSQVLADYREAGRMPAEIRTALEAIHDDVIAFARRKSRIDVAAFRNALTGIVEAFEAGVSLKERHHELGAAEARIDALSLLFADLQARYLNAISCA